MELTDLLSLKTKLWEEKVRKTNVWARQQREKKSKKGTQVHEPFPCELEKRPHRNLNKKLYPERKLNENNMETIKGKKNHRCSLHLEKKTLTE